MTRPRIDPTTTELMDSFPASDPPSSTLTGTVALCEA
jgi:hypothetical protein